MTTADWREADDCETDDAPQTQTVEFLCESDSMERLDLLVSKCCEITRSSAVRLIESGRVAVDGKTECRKSAKPLYQQSVRVTLLPPEGGAAIPQDIPIDIVYEDNDMIVVNKAQGMVVHPAAGNPDGTLVNALLFHCHGSLSGIGGVIRPGIVHRIDKDTSGLLCVAKNDRAHVLLADQIQAHTFTRRYRAVLQGNLCREQGTVDAPIGRHPTLRRKMAVTAEHSKRAVTHYRTLELFRGYTYVELELETGRTHQIRVHMSHLGCPVTGDPLYAPCGGKNPFHLTGQCLHAYYLAIRHPITGNRMEFTAPLPPYFEHTLDILKKQRAI